MNRLWQGLGLALGIFFWANSGIAPAQTATGAGPAEAGLRTYWAQPGDNFVILEQRLGYDRELLAAINNLSPGYSCQGGEALRLPAEEWAEVFPLDPEPAAVRTLASRSGGGGRDFAGGRVWQKPLAVQGTVTSAFASSRNSTGPHHGLDIAVPEGSVILAAHGGVAVEAGWKNDIYGYAVLLDHGNGWQTLYAHCSSVLVSPGQQVAQGERIALVGSTGNSTGPHLHLELHKDGVFLNPARFMGD